MTASERDSERIVALRESFGTWMQDADPSKLVFLDESGSTISMTREYARCPEGERAHDKVPRNRGTVTSMLGALSLKGMIAVMTVEGGTSAEVFHAFVEQVLLPEIEPGSIVVLDNAGAHKDPDVFDLFAKAGVAVKFLPPYSPELNPIELAWAELKDTLRFYKARTREALDDAIALGADLISRARAAAWFRHCGYRCQVI